MALVVQNPSANAGDSKRCEFDPWVRKIPWEYEMALYSSILAWKIPWAEEPGGLQRVHGAAKSQTQRSKYTTTDEKQRLR